MPQILGEGLKDYVANQINDRQKFIGKTNRSQDDMSFFFSKEAWVKLASSSSVNGSSSPSKKYLLFNGRNRASGIKDGGAYDTSDKDFGTAPMPGILSLEVKALNRGSIKEANIKIKANTRKQFEEMEKVYLRLGFNMLIEWGWNIYVTGGSVQKQGATLADGIWWDSANDKKDYTFWLPKIESLRKARHGNYDGFFGKVVNFTWQFNPDGSYDIDLKIISHGDVVESLRTTPPNSAKSGDNSIDISSFYSKLLSNDPVLTKSGIKSATGDTGVFPQTEIDSDENLNAEGKYKIDQSLVIDRFTEHMYNIQFLGWAFNNFKIWTPDYGDGDSITYFKLDPSAASSVPEDVFLNINGNQFGSIGMSFMRNPILGGKKDAFFLYYQPSKENPDDAEIPNITVTETPVYVRFQYVLWFLAKYCLPVNDEGNPPFKIDWGQGAGRDGAIPMYVPDQTKLTLSYDPLNYIVNVAGHTFGTLEASSTDPTTTPYENLTGAIDTELGYLDARNIYCNITHILDKIPITPNDENQTKIDIFGFLKDVCNEINHAFGSINNLEPIMDEDTNTLKIMDSTNFRKSAEILKSLGLEPPRTDYLLQMYGYRKFAGAKVASFVRDVNLSTTISKNMASLITIGATAKGSSPGTDATAFSRLNEGTEDRFATEFVDPEKKSGPPPTPIYKVLENTVKENYYPLYGYNIDNKNAPEALFQKDGKPKPFPRVNADAISKNVQLITDYYAYHESKLHENAKAGSPGIGFLPFEMEFTMDGLSGIKIYNSLQIDSSFLPKSYPRSMEFVLSGVDHFIQNNDWTTKLKVISTPKTTGVDLPTSSPPGTFSGGSTSTKAKKVPPVDPGSAPDTSSPSGPAPEPLPCAYTTHQIFRAVKVKNPGWVWKMGDNEPNIVGIRNMATDGLDGRAQMHNKYDDILVVVMKRPGNPKQEIWCYRVSVDPGRNYYETGHWPGKNYASRYAFGQYKNLFAKAGRGYGGRTSGNCIDVLVQVGNAQYFQDNTLNTKWGDNKNGFALKQTSPSNRGMQVHQGAPNGGGQVNKWSAGCQVFVSNGTDGLNGFKTLVNSFNGIIFDYTLIPNTWIPTS